MLWFSLEVSHWGTSNEHPQHIFLWRNKKNISYFVEKAPEVWLCLGYTMQKYVDSESSDQPTHPGSLIRAFSVP